MRRYRNARYAPESLERKLNPSTMGIAPPPALVGPVAAPTDIISSTPTLVPPTAMPTNVITTKPLVVSTPTSDYLLVDNELPTLPGEGPLVPLVPNPTGPVVPA